MNFIRRAFNRHASQYDKVCVLQQEIAKRLFSRLQRLKPNDDIILDLGAGTGILTQHLLHIKPKAMILVLDIAERTLFINRGKHPTIQPLCADAYQLPIKDGQVAMVISNLMLQWCTDLSNLFREISRILEPEGLFLFSTFGTNTLFELKKSWAVVDSSTHVNDFVDMHDIGDLLAAEFQNPVVESEQLVLTYKKVQDLMLDLKQLGANYVPKHHKGLTGKDGFYAMLAQYEYHRKSGKLPATYEVIYGHAWRGKNSFTPIAIDTAYNNLR